MPLLEDIRRQSSVEYRHYSENRESSDSVGDYVLLYGRNDIEERNQTYEVQTYMPGWFTIGDDSGGQALLMKLDGTNAVYLLGHGALGSMQPLMIAESFASWMSVGCPLPGHDDDEL